MRATSLQGPGEGAGIVDIGDNQAAVFKIESHNHLPPLNHLSAQQQELVGFYVMCFQWEQDQLHL